MNNRQLGNSFESELCEILFEQDFWVHNMAQNQAGQPADIIAAKNGRAYLIDAKVCSSNGFDLTRMESNQDSAMGLWKECGNGEGWFALRLETGDIYMIPHFTVSAYRAQKSSMSPSDIFECGKPLEKWVMKCK